MPLKTCHLRPLAQPGVLDFAPGAAAAYSLRNLSLSYTGPVVTVRRSTDSAERDFTAAEVSDGTLAAWCGGGDGFVKQWWSQTGSNHASQSTAGDQPKIVASGVVVTDGGKPAIDFNGTPFLLTALSLSNALLSVFAISQAAATPLTSINGFVGASESALDYKYFVLGQGFAYVGNGTAYTGINARAQLTASSQSIASFISAGETSRTLIVNGAQTVPTDTTADRVSTFTARIGAQYDKIQTKAQELIIYPTDMTALRQRIEGNLAWYY